MNTTTYTSTKNQRNAENVAFASLFGSSTCKSTFLGEGDTYFGINQIKDWILQNQEEINTNKAISYFKSSSLFGLVQKIHRTINTNFQYKADGFDQELLAPNCAYYRRFKGLDCKTFTVLASVFLLKNQVVHYLRKIKQDNSRPNEFSHIYIVVPKDQTTGSLDSGYYVLDGTLTNNNEPFYLEKHDIKMEKLPYYGLKGAENVSNDLYGSKHKFLSLVSKYLNVKEYEALDKHIIKEIISGRTPRYTKTPTGFNVSGYEIVTPSPGLNGILDDLNLGDIDLGNLDFSSLDSITGFIKCIGGSAYGKNEISVDLKHLNFWVNAWIKDINQNILKKDLVRLSEVVSHTLGGFRMFEHLVRMKRLSKSWNSCSRNNLDGIVLAAHKVNGFGGAALITYLNTYFHVATVGKTPIQGTMFDYVWAGYNRPVQTLERVNYKITEKPGVSKIPAFQMNEQALSYNPANPNNFFETLTSVLLQEPSGASQLPTDNTPISNNDLSENNQSEKKAGFGNLLFGGVLIGTAVYYGGKALKDQVEKKKNSKKDKK